MPGAVRPAPAPAPEPPPRSTTEPGSGWSLLRGGASQWNDAFQRTLTNAGLQETLSRAATSVQDMGHAAISAGESIKSQTLTLAEQSGLQTLAEQSVAATRDAALLVAQSAEDVRDHVAKGAVDLTAQATETAAKVAASAKELHGSLGSGIWSLDDADVGGSSGSVEEFAGVLTAEAKALRDAARAGSAVDVGVLQKWESRLGGDAMGGAPGTAKVFAAFLQSGVLMVVVEALVGSPPNRTQLRVAPGDAEPATGAVLLRLFARASTAPPELLAQALALVADAGDALDAARLSCEATETEAALQDLQWVLSLLRAAVLDDREDGLLQVRPLLESVSKTLGETPAGAPSKGTDVWALWRGNGGWYRAEILSYRAGVVEVRWLRTPPGHKDDRAVEDEYVCETSLGAADDTTFTSVGVADLAPADGPRPSTARGASFEGPDGWAKGLGEVEASARRCRARRELRENLEALHGGGLESRHSDPAERLNAIRSALGAKRAAVDPRVEALGSCVEQCSNEETALQEQIRSGSSGFAIELDALRVKSEESAAELQALQTERQRLLDQLGDIDARIQAVQARGRHLGGREQQIKTGAHGDTDQFCERLARMEERSRRLAAQRRLLLSSKELARVIEQQLDARATAVASVLNEREVSESGRPALAAACLAEELARTKAMEELCATWTKDVWGADAIERLAADRPRLAALRTAHERALILVEQAWRESVQLAAEIMGQRDAPVGLSEALSRAGAQYKEMRQTLANNHGRLMQMGAGLPAQPLALEEPPLRSPPRVSAPPEPAAALPSDTVVNHPPDEDAE